MGGYPRPSDLNIQICPERGDRNPWAEQLEMKWIGPVPETTAQQNRERLALQELG